MIGWQMVGFGVDRDAIRVAAEIGKFERVRLRSLDYGLFINEMKVIYTDGSTYTFDVNADSEQNRRTLWFDVKAGRLIREAQLVY